VRAWSTAGLAVFGVLAGVSALAALFLGVAKTASLKPLNALSRLGTTLPRRVSCMQCLMGGRSLAESSPL
jgi:hypothetical protein